MARSSLSRAEMDDSLSEFNAEQKRAVDLVVDKGLSTFITGGAGTGKSFCVAGLVRALKAKGRRVEVTATTGRAAIAIGGCTIHHFANIVGNETNEEIKRRIVKRVAETWKNLDVLVIDEISMMHIEFFERLNYTAQYARGNPSPFGGLQIVAVGDFFQLPPVTKRTATSARDKTDPVFCFESPVWDKTFKQSVVELKQVFRQSDPEFIECLQRMRWGWKGGLDVQSQSDAQLLMKRLHRDLSLDGIKPTFLHSRTDVVNRINQEHLDAIDSPPHEYHLVEGFMYPKEESVEQQPPRTRVDRALNELKRSVPVDSKLTLKVGAQVMLVCNLSVKNGLANGSRGVVVEFSTREKEHDPVYPIVRFCNGMHVKIRAHMWKKVFREQVYAYVAHIPLKLAYAHTIHKSQGQSLDAVEVSLDRSIFEDGQAYTALSRVRSLQGLSLREFDPSCIRANPKVVKFYTGLANPQRLLDVLKPLATGPNQNEEDEEDEEEEDVEEAEKEEDEEEEEEEEEEHADDDQIILDEVANVRDELPKYLVEDS